MNNTTSGATAPTISSAQTLIQIANRAKTIGEGEDYVLANTIFAVLLDQWFVQGPESELSLVIESQDPDGSSSYQAHYDVVRLQSGGESLCIPLPLLAFTSAVAVVKAVERVEQQQHFRVYEEPKLGELDALWKEFWLLVDQNEVAQAVERHLAEWPGNDCGENHWSFILFSYHAAMDCVVADETGDEILDRFFEEGGKPIQLPEGVARPESWASADAPWPPPPHETLLSYYGWGERVPKDSSQ